MPTLSHNQVNIAYKDTGKGEITLLFIHGSFIDSDYWMDQIEFFKDSYRIIAPDLPGHGKSGKNREIWNIKEFGKDICFLIRTLKLKNVILIGHSMGGDIALETAVACQDSIMGLIGIDNFKYAGTQLPEEISNQTDYILHQLKVDFANTSENYARMVLLSESTEPSIREKLIKDYRNMDPHIGYEIIKDAFFYFDREQELLLKLRHKLYLLNVDYLPTNESLLEKYAASGYEFISLPGSCHYPMLENASLTNQILRDLTHKIINIS